MVLENKLHVWDEQIKLEDGNELLATLLRQTGSPVAPLRFETPKFVQKQMQHWEMQGRPGKSGLATNLSSKRNLCLRGMSQNVPGSHFARDTMDDLGSGRALTGLGA